MSMPFFITVLVVGVLPLIAAAACVVRPILAGDYRRKPERRLAVQAPEPASYERRVTSRDARTEPARTLRRPVAVRAVTASRA